MRWLALIVLVVLLGFVMAFPKTKPMPLESPKTKTLAAPSPGAEQPNAPGQRSPATLPQLELGGIPEIRKVEYASNGFIEVAHALILLPKTKDTLVHALALAQQTAQASFKARPILNEVDISVYQAESFDGIGGPLPRFTASVPKSRLSEFLALTRAKLPGYDRAWINPGSLVQPKRKPVQDREQTPTFRDPQKATAQTPGQPQSGLLFRGDPKKPIAALTFDDAPHPLYEPLLLDILRRAKTKATFFCIGRNAKAYPYFVRDMIAQGHELGNHTYHHVRLPQLPDADVRDELTAANAVLKNISGKFPRFFRPPGGEYSTSTLRISKALGLTTAFWTDDPGDFDNPGQRIIEQKLEQRLRPGGIVLLHDNVLETIRVLPVFLNVALKRNIKLKPLGVLAGTP